MELDESSKYALGALFVAALHANELKAGSEVNHGRQVPWGEHSEKVLVVDPEAPEEAKQEVAARWDAFWGRDLVISRGLLERVFAKLGIDGTSWPGLKVLPEVAGEAGYDKIVQQYRGMLDGELKALEAPVVDTQPPLNAPEQPNQRPQDLEGQVEADDEDLARDLKRSKFQGAGQRPGESTAEGPPDIGGLSLKPKKAASPLRLGGAAKSGALPAPAAAKSGQDSMSASELSRSLGAGDGPTPLAFMAVTQLLEACVSSLDMPKLQDIVKADPNTKKAAKVEVAPELPGSEKAANVRWYDSRAREAVARVADWLQVPWSKVLLYECMLAQQSQVPEAQGDGKKQLTARERQMKALKIGAAAAGGGAILALTGGLAAPALAAVAGTALTAVGGASAAAAITGLVGSSVGAAAIIAGFGAGGAHVVGGKMARRIGDVKEFGFREIPDDEGFHSYFSVAIPTPDQDPSDLPSSSRPPSEATAQGGGQSGGSWFSSGTSTVSSWMPWSKAPETDAGPLLPIPVSAKPRADPKLSRTIAVAGWIVSPSDFVDQWRGLSNTGAERFTLVWESQELVALTRTMMDMILNQALSQAGKYLIENFVIHGLVGAVALPMTVLNVSGLIDSTWAVVMNRAARAGELLAHLLMSGAHGDCPVNLVGHSMGARLIFHCLLELCRCQCKGIVQNAVMMGTPVDVIPERWAMARSVVSGRCVNAYSKNDWVLALSFRARQGTFRPAAGLGAISVPGVENVDLSDLVNGHGDWVKNMDVVLRRLDLAQQ